MKKIFKGIMPALITPLNDDGLTVNEKSTRELIEFQLSQGADGFYVLGSTGEGIILSEEERMKMLEICVSQVAGRKPVICHVASMNFDEALRLAKHCEAAGADAVSAIPPIFFHYTTEDIYNYYKKLATATSLPFVMYNHSAANGGLSAEQVAKMFEIDNVTGVKWTVNNYFELMRLRDMTHGEMNVINGPDEMLVCGLMAGADAGIGTTYNVMLPDYLALYKAIQENRIEDARALQYKVNRVISAILKYELIPAIKEMCSMMGFPSGNGKAPFGELSAETKANLARDLAAAGWKAN